jgi:uncharacterized protein
MGKSVVVMDSDRRAVVCERCTLAATPLSRLRGLLGRRALPSDEGLLIRPTWAVHTAFMRFPIDLVFLDRDLVVLDVVKEVRAWKAAGRRGAKSVLELAAGEADRRSIRPGVRLAVVEAAFPTRNSDEAPRAARR